MARLFLQHVDLAKNELRQAVIHVLASAPVSPAEGQFYYNSTDKTTYQWNGTQWLDMITIGVGANVVDNVALADMPQDTIKGRIAAGTGDPQDLTAAQVRTIINVEDNADVTDATNVAAAGATMNNDTNLSTNSWFLDEDDFTSNDATKVASQQSTKAYIDSKVVGALIYQGGYAADTNTPDLDTSPSGILKGFTYTVTVAGTFFSAAVEAGDVVIAEIDSPTVEADWTIVNKNVPVIGNASTTAVGLIEIATNAETITGTDTTRAVTPAALEAKLVDKGYAKILSFDIIGDDSTTAFALTHNLNTYDVDICVHDSATKETIFADENRNTVNQVTITFSVAPATSTDYRATIIGKQN